MISRARTIAASLLCLAAALSRPPALTAGEKERDSRPPLVRDVAMDQKLDEQIPLDLEFLDEAGRRVRLGEYFGRRPVVLTLVYYECPMLCTQVLNGLVSSLDVLSFEPGREFELVTVSFDAREGARLAAAKKEVYLRRYKRAGAAQAWHFLTGDEVSIRKLAEAVGFRFAFDPEKNQFAHASGIILITPQGRVSRYFYGIEYAPKDLRLGLVEAADNRIGSPVDQLLLYCYEYDPVKGKYGAVVMSFVRLGGALTVAGLLALIVILRRRDGGRAAAGPGRSS